MNANHTNPDRCEAADLPTLDDAAVARLEAVLAGMALVEPSARLDRRIAAAARSSRRNWRLVGWASGLSGMAAGLLIGILAWPAMFGLDPNPADPTATGPGSTSVLASNGQPETPDADAASTDPASDGDGPVEATVETTQVMSDGVVVLNDRLPVHQIRRITTRHMLYYDEKTNERIEVTTPSEQVIYIAAEPF